ncbi:DUF58 domain-containing protein [Marinigracilibium pacificum]|uniref:DUF58 domain-containing protein n=1 Tax=Marinigracilibium pacificum TaxID=2729599 RepID=A0A848IXX9_9BACT|nr:DUF58 domain-containing protein [Marinigracilibium pacificum]NMM48181.1 DUF58 domain-containing protein [Marinigracilibium pacificum]
MSIKKLYINPPFYLLLLGITGVFFLSFFYPGIYQYGFILLGLFLVTCIVDAVLLFTWYKDQYFEGRRSHAKVFSLGNNNKVRIHLIKTTARSISGYFIDEIPVKCQVRDIQFQFDFEEKDHLTKSYSLHIVERGKYEYGDIQLFVNSPLKIFTKRITILHSETVPAYPSVLDLKKYNLYSIQSLMMYEGIKRIRRIGQSTEFEQIKDYVQGDEIKKINWKATGRTGKLKVNHYEEEKSQQIYSIIDTSRAMYMPFNKMSLTDYAVNASLILSNAAIQKNDKAGLMTFSAHQGIAVKSDKNPLQLKRINEALYSLEQDTTEADFEMLYQNVRKLIKHRSMLMLYTNFESKYTIERVLPVLRKLSKLHLLVVVIFENEETTKYASESAETLRDVYYKVVAGELAMEKKLMIKELQNLGIQTLYTTPQNLSINTLNKYLEMKARGLI